jgi:hypothetical protein
LWLCTRTEKAERRRERQKAEEREGIGPVSWIRELVSLAGPGVLVVLVLLVAGAVVALGYPMASTTDDEEGKRR